MIWHKASRIGEITLNLNEDKVYKILEAVGIEADEIWVDGDDFIISVKMDGQAYRIPAKPTLSNGDPGYPEEYDDDFPINEDSTDYVSALFGGLFTVSIRLDDTEFEQEEPYD